MRRLEWREGRGDLLLVVNGQHGNEFLVLQLHVWSLYLASWYLYMMILTPNPVLPQSSFDMPGLYCPGILNVHADVKDSLGEGVVELLGGDGAEDFLSLRDEDIFIFLAVLLRMVNSKLGKEKVFVGPAELRLDNLTFLPKVVHIPQQDQLDVVVQLILLHHLNNKTGQISS